MEDGQHNSIPEEQNVSEAHPQPPLVRTSTQTATPCPKCGGSLPCLKESCTQDASAADTAGTAKDEETQKVKGMNKSGEPRKVAVCGLCHKSKLGHQCSRQDCPGPEHCNRPDLHRRKYTKRTSTEANGPAVHPYYFEITGTSNTSLPINRPQSEPIEGTKMVDTKIEEDPRTPDSIEHTVSSPVDLSHVNRALCCPVST